MISRTNFRRFDRRAHGTRTANEDITLSLPINAFPIMDATIKIKYLRCTPLDLSLLLSWRGRKTSSDVHHGRFFVVITTIPRIRRYMGSGRSLRVSRAKAQNISRFPGRYRVLLEHFQLRF